MNPRMLATIEGFTATGLQAHPEPCNAIHVSYALYRVNLPKPFDSFLTFGSRVLVDFCPMAVIAWSRAQWTARVSKRGQWCR